MIYKNEIEKLRHFNKDLAWFQDNYNKLKVKFKGEYVAVKDCKVIDHDKNPHVLLVRLKERSLDTSSIVIEYVNEFRAAYVL